MDFHLLICMMFSYWNAGEASVDATNFLTESVNWAELFSQLLNFYCPLQTTEIGRAVNALRKRGSNQIRNLARTLVG